MNHPQNSADDPAEATAARHRPIRSYVIRSGRLTTSQRHAIETLWPRYGVEYRPHLIDPHSLFDQPRSLTVEIGFGMGDSLLEMARRQPEENFIGIEVHPPGVGKLLHGVAEAELSNIRIFCHDAREVLADCMADNSLDRVQIFFPDPWHKKRHNKRRLIQPAFVALLAGKLKPGGLLHLATDWEPYAQHMLEVLEACELLTNEAGPGQFASAGDRPQTRFERRGTRLGHGVRDLRYLKR